MIIPPRGLERWCAEIVRVCTSDIRERAMRGAVYRNLYLTGDPNGSRATFNKTFDAIEDLAAYLCTTSDMRYAVSFPRGGSPTYRAMGNAVAEEMLNQSRACGLTELFEEATKWSLVKGNCFLKMLWTVDGLEPYLIQPEYIGVWRPDICDLDKQEAFTHSTWVTPEQFDLLLGPKFDADPTEAKRLRNKVHNTRMQGKEDGPDQMALVKQIMVGGYQPFQGAGGIGATPQSQQGTGVVAWMNAPSPSFDAKVMANLIKIDELWVRNDLSRDAEGRREWATFTLTGDVLVYGKEQLRNTFADMFDPNDKALNKIADAENPLAYRHPFVEFCPNRLDGYFWGYSEIANLSLLQESLNQRVNGINKILRRQEDPPRWFGGGSGMDDAKYAKLNKPGGYLTDDNPTAKPPLTLAPDIPAGLYESLKENERMFDVMTGMTPTLQGMTSGSLRSQGQTDQMTRNATPRFKTKSLRAERAIQTAASLQYDMNKAKNTTTIQCWIMPSDQLQPEVVGRTVDSLLEPPAPGMKLVEFQIGNMPPGVRILVDGHSASPAFGDEALQKAIVLRKADAMSTTEFIEQVNPPDRDVVIAEAEAAQIQQAQAAQAALAAGQMPQGKPNGSAKK